MKLAEQGLSNEEIAKEAQQSGVQEVELVTQIKEKILVRKNRHLCRRCL